MTPPTFIDPWCRQPPARVWDFGSLWERRALVPVHQWGLVAGERERRWPLYCSLTSLRERVEVAIYAAVHDPERPRALAIKTLDRLLGEALIYGPANFDRATLASYWELVEGLAQMVAALAFQPGGVSLYGHHWCTGSGHVQGWWSETPCQLELDRDKRGEPMGRWLERRLSVMLPFDPANPAGTPWAEGGEPE